MQNPFNPLRLYVLCSMDGDEVSMSLCVWKNETITLTRMPMNSSATFLELEFFQDSSDGGQNKYKKWQQNPPGGS